MMTAKLQRVGFVCGVVIGAVVLLALMLVPGQISRGQGLPPTPAANELGWRTYITAAPQWRYDPASWVPLSDALLSTSTANAQLAITFLGSGVSLHYATSADGGSFSAQIDDQLPETLDTRSAGGAAGDAVWSKAVDPGVHTLTVTHHSGTLRLKSVAVQGDLLDARPVSPTQAAATRPPQVITPQPPVAIASPIPSNSGWTTYQDSDTRLVYRDGTWQTFPVARANGGTLTGTADAGASLTAYFEGSSIRVVYSRGPEGRAFAARIDDALRQTGDAYGRAYSYGHTLAIEGLEYGRHTLTITDNDGAIWIEAIEVQGVLLDRVGLTATPTQDSSWTLYEDTDPRLLYSDGSWENVEVAQASGGSLTGSADPGASFRVAFLGTGIRVLYSNGPDAGSFSATLDGTNTQTFEAHNATYAYQNVLTFDHLADGFHTLHIVNGPGHLRIEGIYLQGTFPAEGITSNGSFSRSPESAAQVLSVPDIIQDLYSYNFDDAAVPDTMTIAVIDHSDDRLPGDGVPGTVYTVDDSFNYYNSSGQLITYPFPSARALGGVSHTNAAVASYQVTLEVEFDLGAPVRFVDYDFNWWIYWTVVYSSHPVHLKLTLSDSNKDLLFAGIICELSTFNALNCSDSVNWNRFAAVDNVRYVTITLETSDPTQDVFAYTYYHVLDDFTFEVELQTVPPTPTPMLTATLPPTPDCTVYVDLGHNVQCVGNDSAEADEFDQLRLDVLAIDNGDYAHAYAHVPFSEHQPDPLPPDDNAWNPVDCWFVSNTGDIISPWSGACTSLPTATPSPTPTIDPNITPTITPTPSGDIASIITELASYGVTAFPNGLSENDSQYSTHAKPWTPDELQAVLNGVKDTATALNSFRNETFNHNESSPNAALFRTIMKPITVQRVSIGYKLTENSHCNGTIDAACTDANSTLSFITFYGDLTPYGGVDQYTTTHELGHLFNVRSGGGNGRTSMSLYGRMQNASVNDYTGVALLFGSFRDDVPIGSTPAPGVNVDDKRQYDEWSRGSRGWGSGPASTYSPQGTLQGVLKVTDFQKNSFTIAGWAVAPNDVKRQTEIDEVAADMFLNWVYRTLSRGGFLNRSWNPNALDPVTNQPCNTIPEGCLDETGRPGDKRFEWMRSNLQGIFSQQSWN